MILKTTDYQIFKKHDANRDIDHLNLKRLVDSIMTCNMLELRPMIVDTDMKVIDGQHRLEAAKKLGLTIYYQIKQDSEPREMYLLNDNQKHWGLEDYLNYHVNCNVKNYLNLKKYMNDNKLPLRQALIITEIDAIRMGKDAYETFKKGKYIFPSAQEMLERDKEMEPVNQILNMCRARLLGYKRFLETSTVLSSLLYFVTNKGYNHIIFMKKLDMNTHIVCRRSKRNDYIDMWSTIYNMHNRNPIAVE